MMPAGQLRARGLYQRTAASSLVGPSEIVMPFDHAASFELKGVPGNIIQDVINISSDGSFVATAIGYGFEEDRARPALISLPASPKDFLPATVLLDQIPTDALIEGFRLNVRGDRLTFENQPPVVGGRRVFPKDRTFSQTRIDNKFGESIIEKLRPVQEISFLFSIVDSGTGRELQDEPIHNLASLGKSNGERPFRLLAQPLKFQPRSTVRLQIVERSEGIKGTLFIVLYGYKTLGGSRIEPAPEARRQFPVSPAESSGGHSPRVIPFDYVASFQLTGSSGNQIEEEIPINVEGGFVATSIGYGLGVETLDVQLKENKAKGTGDQKTIKLSALTLEDFSSSALQEGIRIRPNFIRVALEGGTLSSQDMPLNLANRVFERLNRPEDVSFRYSFFDTGTGRELQNQPINNIAGLGIANGDRPFKKLARPMMLLPRSTIRVNIEERFGRGTLFIVFQGYKLLGNAATAQPPVQGRR
jgi:hypothetical protein